MFYMTIADMNKAERELEALFGWDAAMTWIDCNYSTTDKLRESQMDFMYAVFKFMECWQRAECVAYDSQRSEPRYSESEREAVFAEMQAAAKEIREIADWICPKKEADMYWDD